MMAVSSCTGFAGVYGAREARAKYIQSQLGPTGEDSGVLDVQWQCRLSTFTRAMLSQVPGASVSEPLGVTEVGTEVGVIDDQQFSGGAQQRSEPRDVQARAGHALRGMLGEHSSVAVQRGLGSIAAATDAALRRLRREACACGRRARTKAIGIGRGSPCLECGQPTRLLALLCKRGCDRYLPCDGRILARAISQELEDESLYDSLNAVMIPLHNWPPDG